VSTIPEPNRSTTARGFTTYDEFTDVYGSTVTVRESSAVLVDGQIFVAIKKDPESRPSAVWVHANNPNIHDVSPHLNAQHARRLAAALVAFADEAEGVTK
jgi:hypothetical protein